MSKVTKGEKLSAVQQKVLDMMRDGWELGSSGGIDGRCWLQKGGLGRGCETMTVSVATVSALHRAGRIKHHYGFPTTRYTITEEPTDE